MADVATLDIFDIGLAAYKHFCLRGTPRLCLTPLLGVQLALMSPANATRQRPGSQVFNYAAVGARGELDAVATRSARATSTSCRSMVGVNVYSPGVLRADRMPARPRRTLGLDTGGAAGYVGLGYTYRFNTPFGRAPFVTLE